jgi:hypothetical protein
MALRRPRMNRLDDAEVLDLGWCLQGGYWDVPEFVIRLKKGVWEGVPPMLL